MHLYFSHRLLELTEALNELPQTSPLTLGQSSKALAILEQCDREFREYVVTHGFDTDEDEIRYFRHERPQLLAHWVYFSRIHDVELKRPFGTSERLYTCYEEQLRRMDAFHDENRWFIAYIREGDTQLDPFYFLRYNLPLTLCSERCYLTFDYKQTTLFDIRVGKLLAFERLDVYFRERLRELQISAPVIEVQQTVVPSPTKSSEEKLLRSYQVERRLGVSRSSLLRMRNSGKIGFVRINNIIWYYESDVQTFLDKNRHTNFDD